MSRESPCFPGVRGHQHAQAALSRAITRDQLHHGLIFMGPGGIGKAALARGMACALHCEVAPAVGCGRCVTCRRILEGVHAGFELVEPEEPGGTIKVDAARELSNRLQHAPFEGRHHVVVFDPADALTEQAYNALLKSIEEPAPGIHFVMITTHPEGLLPTILSRCMPVRLGPLSSAVLEQVVDEALARGGETKDGDEAPAPPDAQRRALALRLSQGSAGRALELLVDASLPHVIELVRAAMEATREGPAAIFCGDRGPLWTAWSQASGGAGPGRPARERAACARATDLWLLHLREHLRGEAGLPGLPRVEADVPAVLRQLDKIQALREGLERNPNVRLAIEQTLLELCA